MLPYRIRARAERQIFVIVVSVIASYASAFVLGLTRFAA